MNGIYCLDIRIESCIGVPVGALGDVSFEPGTYVYVGSAQRNLEARIRRHCSHDKKICWHIDYLLAHPAANIRQVFVKSAGKRAECETARLLASYGKVIPRFGASDCRCGSHLIRTDRIDMLSGYGFEDYSPPYSVMEK